MGGSIRLLRILAGAKENSSRRLLERVKDRKT